MVKNQNQGIYWAITAAVVSGVSIFINKFAVDAIKQPLVFTSVKNTGVAILIMAILVFTGKWKKVKEVSSKDRINLLLIGVIGGSIPFALVFTGLLTIPAINGAIIQKTLVLWVTVLAVVFLKEKFPLKKTALVVMLFGANVLVGGFAGFKFSPGEILVLSATLFWSVETVIPKSTLARVDPLILTAARMGIGAGVLLIICLVWQPAALFQIVSLKASQWFWLGLTAITLLGYVTTWYRALKYAPASTVTAVLVGSTLVTNILTALFSTHSFNSVVIIQSLLIITGIKLLIREKTKFDGSSNLSLQSPLVSEF